MIHPGTHDLDVKPELVAGFIERLFVSWNCKREFGHCYHPIEMIDWYCCICGKETDGMPEQQCIFCKAGAS